MTQESVLVPREQLEKWRTRFRSAQMFAQSTEISEVLAQPSDGALTNEGGEQTNELLRLLRIAWGADHVSAEDCRKIDAVLSSAAAVLFRPPAPASLVLPETAAGVWHEGSPPNPWDSEWFLANMAQGDFVVLRPLPEEYAYDFTTADGTYVMRKSIVRWAQLSGSEYIAPASTESRS